MKDFRRTIRNNYGIYLYKELHATELVGGRGNISSRIVTKYERSIVFRDFVNLTNSLPSCRIIDAYMPRNHEDRAFERLLNRINRTMISWNSNAFLICDEGKEAKYTKMARRMSIHNPIPSRFGTWSGGSTHRNITLNNIIEDPVFKNSEKSYFIQLADCCAYALLRRENQLASKNIYNIHTVYSCLANIKVRQANSNDPEGIIR